LKQIKDQWLYEFRNALEHKERGGQRR
jgi:hypothetical protein